MIYAIGAFDGFHLGHRALLNMAEKIASEQNCGWGVITFDHNPQFVLADSNFKVLFNDSERDIFARCIGIKKLVKIAFTKEFSELSAEAFLKLLEEKYQLKGLVVGEDFRFGKNRSGDIDFLKKYCEVHKLILEIVPSVIEEGTVLSSTSIRALLSEGKISAVNKALAFPYMISGIVERGEGRGKTLGFPTANVSIDENKVYPKVGSYVSLTMYEGELYPSVTNIGFNPTFEGNKMSCETYIINFDADLYGKELKIFLLRENREEIKFESKEQLVQQLKIDAENAASVAEKFSSENGGLISEIKAAAFDRAGLV